MEGSAPQRRSRDSHQLPPGKHGLPRSFVVSNQRERILNAVADVVSERGYSRMSVEDIIKTAGVSRRTFYDYFESKEDVFLASYDAISALLIESVAKALAEARREVSFRMGIRECVRAFLEFVASEPAFAKMCIVEVLAAGREAIRRRNEVMRTFTGFIEHAGAQLPSEGHPPAITAEVAVGGLYAIVYRRVLEDRTAELPELLPDLAFCLMAPYLGKHAAIEESNRIREAALAH